MTAWKVDLADKHINMAKKNAEVEVETEVVAPEIVEAEAEVKPEKGVATVRWSGKVREYSLAQHG